ncbi:MAG: hypothetical protein FD124_1990 [Alphaproteobacteria bacterium]|nr:MAG: hypothetical protein FD160_3630 [Caulobacteraceae bacterium]TPW05821.1 MAG: hypothetical protein FD124_1990 [Alphaproteobacteria bacterium]
MNDEPADTRTLAEREADATDAFNDLRSDANDAKDRLDDLGRDVSGLEREVRDLDDRVFDLVVQESGAMDLQNGPIVADTDDAGEIMAIVGEGAEGVRGDLIDLAEGVIDARADLTDLETDLTDMTARADALATEVEAIRADGGDIHRDDVEAQEDDGMDAWTDAQLHEPAPADETLAD